MHGRAEETRRVESGVAQGAALSGARLALRAPVEDDGERWGLPRTRHAFGIPRDCIGVPGLRLQTAPCTASVANPNPVFTRRSERMTTEESAPMLRYLHDLTFP